MTFYARVTSYSDRGSDWSRQDPGVVTTPFSRADQIDPLSILEGLARETCNG